MGNQQQRNSPLHLACASGDIKSVQHILTKDDCDINCQNDENSTPLHLACYEGHTDIVKLLLAEKECNINCQDEDGDTPLHLTCYSKGDSLEIVQLLIDKGCEPNCRNKKQKTPLHIAAHKGNVKLICTLMTKGKFDLSLADQDGNTPLHHACYSGSLDTAKELITCNINSINRQGNTPLHIACMGSAITNISDPLMQFLTRKHGPGIDSSGFISVAKLLLEQSECDSNHQNKDGATPLHIVCAGGQLEIFKLLIERSGCDINCRDECDNSPLHLACRGGHPELIKILLKKEECIVSAENEDGNTPLHMACKSKDDHSEIVRLLIEKGCDPNFRNKKRKTPLHIAALKGNVKIVCVLLDTKRCILTLPDKDGNNPLHHACYSGSLDTAKELLSCNINSTNRQGNTPLHIACMGSAITNISDPLMQFLASKHGSGIDSSGFISVAKLFLEQSECDSNHQNRDGATPLHIVCAGGQLEIFKLLIERSGCDINCKDKMGNSPLHLACHEGHTEMVQILLSKKECQITCQDEDGDTPLHMACYGSSIQVIRLLINKGCDPNCQNKKKRTPLQIASHQKDERMMAALLQTNFTANQQRLNKTTSLHLACRTGQIQLVKQVLSKVDCDINSTDESGNTPLHIACFTKQLNLIELLLTSPKCDPNIKNTEGMASIHIASMKGRTDIINLLLNKKGIQCNPNLKAGNGRTALHAACFGADVNMVTALLSHKDCDVNCKDEEGATPLHYASSGKSFKRIHGVLSFNAPSGTSYIEIAKAILAVENCELNSQLLDGSTPLHLACKAGFVEIAKLLLQRNSCDPNSTDEDGDTPLHIACNENNSELVELLLKSPKCNPNIANMKEIAPIHMASMEGLTDIIKLLVHKQGIQCNLKAENGRTALHAACFFHHLEVVKLLLTHKDCDVNCRDEEGATPLHYATSHPISHLLLDLDIAPRTTCIEMTKAILKREDCDPNYQLQNGSTPLHLVCRAGQVEIASILLNNDKVKPNLPDEDGDTPLHIACYRNKLEIVQVLLPRDSHLKTNKKKCDPNLKNSKKLAPIHIASLKGLADIVTELCLCKECNINAKVENGRTPLHAACLCGHSDVVKKLLSNGKCDVNCKDNTGATPLHYASSGECCDGRHVEIAKLLLERKDCDPNCKDRDGSTPLHFACYSHKDVTQIIRILLQTSACDPNIQDSNGMTPLHVACEGGFTKKILQLLNCESKKSNGKELNSKKSESKKELDTKKLDSKKCDLSIKGNHGLTCLHIACLSGKLEVVKLLLGNLSDPPLDTDDSSGMLPISDPYGLKITDDSKATALHHACRGGNKDIVEELLRLRNWNINCQTETGDTPLHIACEEGNADIAELLLNKRSCQVHPKRVAKVLQVSLKNVRRTITRPETPLGIACETKNIAILGVLINSKYHKLQKQQIEQIGHPPLIIACQCGDLDVLQKLIERTSINVNKIINGTTMLHEASASGGLDIVKHLVEEEKAQCDLTNEDGDQPIHLACANGHKKVVDFFLENSSIQVDQKNKNGNTPLHLACEGNHKEVIMQLATSHECDLNLKNNNNEMPLHVSCRKLHLDSVCILLNEARCQLDSLNAAGKTPLYEAVQAAVKVNKEETETQDDAISVITAYVNDKRSHCDINPPSELGETALMVAVSQPYSEYQLCIIEAILHAKHFDECTHTYCAPICDSKTGDTALHVACKNGNLKLVQWLIVTEKVDPTIQNKTGNTALHSICLSKQVSISKRKEIFHLLVQHPKFDPCITETENGNTPLHLMLQGEEEWYDLNLLEQLVNHEKFDPNVQNKSGSTVMHVLCLNKDISIRKRKEVFHLLVQHTNFNPSVTENVEGNTPLHLMLQGECTKSHSYYSWPQFHYSHEWYDESLIRCLVTHVKFDPNVQNKTGNTVVHVLGLSKKVPISSRKMVFNLLVQHPKFNPCITETENGNTPLHIMLQEEEKWDSNLLQYLVYNKNFDPNIQNQTGDTILHVLGNSRHGSYSAQQNVLNVLMKHSQIDPFIKNVGGNTALHLMLQNEKWYDASLLTHFVNHEEFDPNVHNKSGNTVMHVVCLSRQVSISKRKQVFHLLMQHPKFNPCITETENSNTPLHLMLQCKYHRDSDEWYDVNFLIHLLNHERFDPNFQNKIGITAMHMLCLSRKAPISKRKEVFHVLVQHPNFNPLVTETENGNTPLHLMLQNEEWHDVKLLAHLVNHWKFDPNIQNRTGNTVMHILCLSKQVSVKKRKEIFHLLEKHSKFNPCITETENGNTPLHLMFQGEEKWDSALLCKIITKLKSEILKNENGDTILHSACYCNIKDSEVIVQLSKTFKEASNITNSEGKTPLHIAAARGNSSLIQPLIEEMQADPIARDKEESTPLHLACLNGHLQVVRALLACGRAELDAKNADSKTPMEVDTTSEIKKEMSKYHDIVSNTLKPFMKLFVIGDSGAGKSTLIQALCKDLPTVAKFIPKAMRRVTKPEPCTPGIIPYTFTSTRLGDILLYDFAGQDEYYTSHSAVLQHSTSRSPPVFLLVVNITEAEEELKKGIKKWLKFIRQYTAKAMKETKVQKPPQLVIIASHVDSLSSRADSGLQRKQKMIVEFVENDVKERQYYKFSRPVIPLDCRDSVSTGIQQLLTQLHSCRPDSSRKDLKVDVGCRYLHAFLVERNTKAISVENLARVINSGRILLPSNPSSLFELASTLNETGQILLLKNADQHEKSWIITDEFREELLCKIIGKLPKLGKEEDAKDTKVKLKQRIGIITHTELRGLFREVLSRGIDIDLIMNLMRHLEFCHDINPEDFPLAEKISLEFTEKEKYYFFPHVVSKERPDSSDWKLFTVKWGWYLECVEGSRLTSRFLHVLLQRLVKFPLNLDEHEGKRLTIWRRGLRWTGNSIKTVVDVGKHNESVVVLASCSDDCKIECAQHLTALIKLILDIKDVTCCDSTEVKESLIVPHAVTYPVQIMGVDETLSLNYIAKCSLGGQKFLIYGKNEEQIDLANVIFDPYRGFNKNTLWKLFREVTSNEMVRDNFLETIADLMCKTHISFEAVNAGEEVAIQLKQFDHSDSSECLKIVQKLTDNGKDIHTMKKLQRKLNECSTLYQHLVTLVMTVDHRVDHPANGTSQVKIVPEKNIRFMIQVTGSDPKHTYQWQWNQSNLTDSDKYRGTTTATLTVMNVVKADEGNFVCTVTNTEGSVPSSVAELIVLDPPTISTHPHDKLNIIPGTSVTFTVTAAGSSIYTWMQNGSPLPSCDRFVTANEMLTIQNVQPSDVGSYCCVVFNAVGSITSNSASLTLINTVPETIPELRDLANLPIPRDQWRKLGLKLSIDSGKLNEIQRNCQHSPDFSEDCSTAMFEFWLNNDNSPTYKRLVEGLQAAGMVEAVTFIHQT